MCGISGIINFDGKKVNEKDLRLMMSIMKHRGPDDEGVYIDNNIGLGFVRLSILDLSENGHQPMISDDHRYVLIYNGEVYNYIEIREGLSHKYNFKSGTDTEVVLAAYQEWGETCLDKLNGMFAFVIYDTKTKNVFAARDRFGIKPFFYYVDDTKLVFASEIKSILPLISKEPNYNIIYDYLMFNRTDHSENTFFKNVKRINPGCFLKINNLKKISIHKWYDISKKINEEKHLSKEDFRDLFVDSLKLRLRSDVPVGVQLSGGIDSSAVVSSLVADFQLIDLNTFSAIYDKNDDSDESEFIFEYKPIVKNLFTTIPNADSFFDDFEELIEVHTEPFPGVGNYIQYRVMNSANGKVKVTLNGQGADELLAGYHNFFSIYYLELIKKLKLYTFLKELIYYLIKHGFKNLINNIKYFIYYLIPISLQNMISSNRYSSVNKSFFKNVINNNNKVNSLLYKPDSLNHSMIQHVQHKLEHMLRWDDLHSMAYSIESRVPFLDYRLVEATLSTPSSQKINDGETKHILREALRDILPKKIAERKDKKGFSCPEAKWFRSSKFKSYIFNLINSDKFSKRGLFNPVIANKVFKSHLQGRSDSSIEIWKWINMELWFQKYIDK